MDEQPELTSDGRNIDAVRKRMQNQMINGVMAGGWDSDDYLKWTKSAPPPPPDTREALRQAEAYVEMLREKGLPPRPDVEAMIAEMKAGADWDEVDAVGDGNTSDEFLSSLKTGGSVVNQEESAERARLYLERQRKAQEKIMAAAAKPPVPPPATTPAVPAPPAPPKAPTSPPPAPVSMTGGVVSGGNYAQMMGSTLSPATPPSLPKPVAAPTPAVQSSGGVQSGSSYAALSGKAAITPAAPLPMPPSATPPAPPAPRTADEPSSLVAESGRRIAPSGDDQPPLPDKDPRDLRHQYEQYLQACVKQERVPTQQVLDLIARVCEKHPPTPQEDEVVRNIARCEKALGVAPLFPDVPIGVSSSAAPPPPTPAAPVNPVAPPLPALSSERAAPQSPAAVSAGVSSSATASPEALGRALSLLKYSNEVGLGALAISEREELLDALIGSLAVVQSEIRTSAASAGCPAVGSPAAGDATLVASTAAPSLAVSRGSPLPSLSSAPKASDLVAGTSGAAPSTPASAPLAATQVGGVVSGSSYASMMGGNVPSPAAAPPAAPKPSASTSAARGVDLVGKNISPASTYYVEGMESMDTKTYMAALEMKLQKQKLERKKKLGNNMGFKASENYMQWLEEQNRSS